MAWLHDGERNIEDTFIRFDTIHERDGQTDTACRHRQHLTQASRSKNDWGCYHKNCHADWLLPGKK